MEYNSKEMVVCEAARQLKDGDVVFVGIGLPNMACNLARRRMRLILYCCMNPAP